VNKTSITNNSYQRIIKFGRIILETACFGAQSWFRRTTLADPRRCDRFTFSSVESTCIANSALLYSCCLFCTRPLVLAFRRQMIMSREAVLAFRRQMIMSREAGNGIKLYSLSQFWRLHEQLATHVSISIYFVIQEMQNRKSSFPPFNLRSLCTLRAHCKMSRRKSFLCHLYDFCSTSSESSC